MIQRKTQNIAFWREQYQVNEGDHEFMYETLLDATEPRHLDDLALLIIERRCRLEDQRIRDELARGLMYDPKEQYKVGDHLVLPAFDFRMAEVTDVRRGENPEHGAFEVITVEFEDNGDRRMFAASLAAPHVLNRDGADLNFGDDGLLSVQELFEEAGVEVVRKLEQHLRANPQFFVNAGSLWMTADQMVEVNVGHLNIAEAAIEMHGDAHSTAALLETVELGESPSETVRVFSLETALYSDDRFVQVGQGDETAWFLRRMMPPQAVEMPPALTYQPVTYDRSALDVELLQIEWDLNDELTVGGLAEDVPSSVPSTSVVLIYPHFISGTLPLPPAAASIFPQGSGYSTAVTLVDGRWGTRFRGWVVHSGRYVAGLGDWYRQHKLPVGARITIESTNNPLEVVVDFRPQRSRRDWVRSLELEAGRVFFQMQRHQVACEFDDHVLLVVNDPAAVELYREELDERGVSIRQLVRQIMPELVKLNPQGTVHMKSLYSAINVLRRVPPGPIFAALAQIPEATDTGSGFWSL